MVAEGWEITVGGGCRLVTFHGQNGSALQVEVPDRICTQLAAALDPASERYRGQQTPQQVPGGFLARLRHLWRG